MKVRILRATLLVAILVMFVPGTAHAQESDNCENFYCTAYAMYSSGSITGYVQYYDDSEDWYLGVDAYVWDQLGNETWCNSDEEYDTATAYCSYPPGSNGVWDLVGYPWYSLEGDEVGDGAVYYDVGVMNMPSGEISVVGPLASVGDVFYATLQPTSFNFDAYQAAEYIGSTTDGCYNTYHRTSQPVSGSAAPPFNLSNNQYQDTVASPPSYVAAYEDATNQYQSSCGWSAYQQMSYNSGPPYVSRYLTQTISYGNQVTTCRDACTTIY